MNINNKASHTICILRNILNKYFKYCYFYWKNSYFSQKTTVYNFGNFINFTPFKITEIFKNGLLGNLF